ncbi:DHH family phosphoesterase [Eremococcus coleocola]|uniref:DHHA1 domain protein n=1 Tax=Eremococcus coleocola ACS-139-V-Col8 TaxID=908337 RepID=E4KM03_9LACT|nr:bifunctional oligoribonuclease/PAP phosphatase NrnA [Eremococcus coleocola]EFR32011.1 DHHA1 domain protein [Eremococcus coleocola ACS-139-V-Col8]
MYIDTQKIQALYAKIKAFDTIIIHRHQRPDPDALGSQLGLKALLVNKFPNKRILAAGSNLKSLEWLGMMDKVTKEDYQEALVIVCDTANRPRVDGQHFDQGQALVKIDHHVLVDSYGDPELVYTQSSSTSEMVTYISKSLGADLPMTQEAAILLYAGILGDTGRFLFSTSSDTFTAAAYLTEFDLPLRELTDHFQVMPLAEFKFHSFAMENLDLLEPGIAVLHISQADIKAHGITEDQTNSVVNIPSQIEGMYAWLNFVEQEGDKPKWRVRLRSKGPVINKIAEEHGGGGHPMAAGADAYSQEEIQTIIEKIQAAVAEYRKEQSK